MQSWHPYFIRLAGRIRVVFTEAVFRSIPLYPLTLSSFPHVPLHFSVCVFVWFLLSLDPVSVILVDGPTSLIFN